MKPVLLGPDGQPIRKESLTTEIVTPAFTGVSHIFDKMVAPGLDGFSGGLF